MSEMKQVPLAWYDLIEENDETAFNWSKPYTVEIQDDEHEWCELQGEWDKPLNGISIVQNGRRYWPSMNEMTESFLLKMSPFKTFQEYIADYNAKQRKRIRDEMNRYEHAYRPNKLN